MENEHYICEHSDSCQYARNRRCNFGSPMSENILRKMYGGTFNPQLGVVCSHPEVRTGVLLIKVKSNNVEGNYHNIWIH